jgi:hypothetical protein
MEPLGARLVSTLPARGFNLRVRRRRYYLSGLNPSAITPSDISQVILYYNARVGYWFLRPAAHSRHWGLTAVAKVEVKLYPRLTLDILLH